MSEHTSDGIKRMKHKLIKKWLSLFISLSLIAISVSTVKASDGEIGIFGGISVGDYLPKNIEKHVTITNNTTPVYAYKEMVFISGEPIEVTGTITVDVQDSAILSQTSGIYSEQYTVDASNTEKGVTLSRSVSLDTAYYIREGEFKRQIVKDSKLVSWDESITTSDGLYTLDGNSLIFSKSSVEDITAGISYYSTTLSYSGTFYDADGNSIDMIVEGNINGYKQPWSKVESQKLRMTLHSTDLGLDMDITLEPRLEAKKTIYYDENQPFPISFGGTYNQRMEREATLQYDVLSYHPNLAASQVSNSLLLTTANEVEKLPIPEGLDFIEGHWAEDDIKKLYSMQIFTETPHEGMQYEAMSRGDYVKALCLAMDIDTSQHENPQSDAPQIFGDVPIDHPLYPYIMGAYDAKLVKGTGEDFDLNMPITREEAFVIYIRVIGLERLGVTGSPTTPFIDDDEIASWAKKEILAGYRLGIIKGDKSGKVNPKKWISKAEAAAIINRLIDYCRQDIGSDY